jgi:hypothetical protein
LEAIKLKPEVDVFDLLRVDPSILEMIAFTYDYCLKYNLKCMITSLMEDVAGRRTSTHSDGRSVDFHSETWGDFHISRFQHMFREKFRGRGAFNSKGEDRPIVYHKVPGGAAHFHMQVRRRTNVNIA